jgi:hypothetical protein
MASWWGTRWGTAAGMPGWPVALNASRKRASLLMPASPSGLAAMRIDLPNPNIAKKALFWA